MREGAISTTAPPRIAVDKSPAGYSWQVALQPSPLPLHQPELSANHQPRPTMLPQRTAKRRLTGCLSRGVQPSGQVFSVSLSHFRACQSPFCGD
jgi:hypothetical protein